MGHLYTTKEKYTPEQLIEMKGKYTPPELVCRWLCAIRVCLRYS